MISLQSNDRPPDKVSMITIDIPGLKVISEANNRDNRFVKQKRKIQQQTDIGMGLYRVRSKPTVPCSIRLIRIAPKPITDEHDNLRSAFKACSDMVGFWLQPHLAVTYMYRGKMIANKGPCDVGIKWDFAQETGPWGVRIKIL